MKSLLITIDSDAELVFAMDAQHLKHPRYLCRKAYAGFIAGWPWEWFVTLTFSQDVHEERASKLFRLWISKLNRELYGVPRKKRPRGVYWVLAFETQKSGRWHIHALVTGVKQARRLSWMDKWTSLDKVTGWARIEDVRDEAAVSKYLTKYVSKDGRIEFSKNLRAASIDLASPEFGSLTNPCTDVAKLSGK